MSGRITFPGKNSKLNKSALSDARSGAEMKQMRVVTKQTENLWLGARPADWQRVVLGSCYH